MAASNALAGELIMRCFNARTTAHILHLQTSSYAAHKALEEFYDSIVDLADSFAEAYQGCFGIIKQYPTVPAFNNSKQYNEGLVMLTELDEWIDANRKKIGAEDDTYLQNIIDEIETLIESTRYKLRFLK